MILKRRRKGKEGKKKGKGGKARLLPLLQRLRGSDLIQAGKRGKKERGKMGKGGAYFILCGSWRRRGLRGRKGRGEEEGGLER